MKKINVRVTSFMLSLILGLTGCSLNNYDTSNVIEIETDDLDDFDLSNDKFLLKEDISISKKYSNDLDNYEVKYGLNELLDEDFNKYPYDDYQVKCNFKYNGFTEVYSTIINNSIKYSSINNKENALSLDSSSGLNRVISDTLYTYLYDITTSKNDIVEDMHSLSRISIVYEDSDLLTSKNTTKVYAKFDYNDYTVKLNKDILTKYYEDNDINSIKQAINHELNHVRQYKCDCRLLKEKSSTISYDSMVISSLLEASAESKTYYNSDYRKYLKNINTYRYENERSIESYLSMLSIFNNKNMDDYYNSIFDSNYNKLVDFYDIDKKDLYKILYDYDAIMIRNGEAEQYVNTYNIDYKSDNNWYHDYVIKMNSAYLVDIYRLYLKKIVETSEKDKLTYVDCLVLQEIFRERMLNNLYVTTDEDFNKLCSEDNIKDVLNMENIFNNYIKEYYNITDKEIDIVKDNNNFNNILLTMWNYVTEYVLYENSYNSIENTFNNDLVCISLKNMITKYPNILFGYYNNQFYYVKNKEDFDNQVKLLEK